MTKIYLNKDVSELVGITRRQGLAWSEKGLVVPARETRGAGVKRGYDYTNLIEFSICKCLFGMGYSVQGVKKISSRLAEFGEVRRWVSDQGEYFRKYYEIGGGFFSFLPSSGSGTIEDPHRGGDMEKSLHRLFTRNAQFSENASGVLFYFSDGRLFGRSVILPRINFDDLDKLSMALKHIYKMLIHRRGSAVSIDIGQLKIDIDTNLKMQARS